MKFILSLLMNASTVVTPGTATDSAAPAIPPAAKVDGALNCDGSEKPKAAEVLTADPKLAEQKAVEDKALQNLGLKKAEVKKPSNVVSGVGEAMETCK
jgi:hypothetical protein